MSLSREGLLALLADWGVEQETVQHPLSPTCELHSENLRGTPLEKYIGNGQAKNLFFKVPSSGGPLKNRLFLVCALVETVVDNKALSARLSIKPSSPLRFATDDVFDDVLRIPKGSVNPFVMAQETCKDVTLLLDDQFLRCERLLFHPMQSDYTTAISPQQLEAFLQRAAPGKFAFVDLSSAAPLTLPDAAAAAAPVEAKAAKGGGGGTKSPAAKGAAAKPAAGAPAAVAPKDTSSGLWPERNVYSLHAQWRAHVGI